MKNFLICFLALCCCFFTSCNKENVNESVRESVTDARNLDCRGCDGISAEIILLEEGDCCKYRLSIRAEEPCRQSVVINGEIVGFVIKEEMSFDFEVCEELVSVQILGYNQETDSWDLPCFDEKVDCGKCSCRGTELKITKIAEDEFCCEYNIKAFLTSLPDPDCKYVLKIGNDSYSLNNVSLNKNIKVCGKPVEVTLTVNGKVCKKETLDCSCCEGLDYTITSLGATPGGCCKYQVNISNGTDCKQCLYGENFNVIGCANPFTSISQTVEVCFDGTITEPFYIGQSKKELCEKFELAAVCQVANCCDNVSLVAEHHSINDKGCCVFKVTLTNESECTQYLFNEYGYSIAVPSGQTYTALIPYCYDPDIGIAILYYAGPSTNVNEACDKVQLTAVCPE